MAALKPGTRRNKTYSSTARVGLGYAAQTNPTLDPTLTRTLTLILALTPTQPYWGALGLLSRSAGVVLSLRAILTTLHVRAIIRLVHGAVSTGFLFLRHCYALVCRFEYNLDL